MDDSAFDKLRYLSLPLCIALFGLFFTWKAQVSTLLYNYYAFPDYPDDMYEEYIVYLLRP